MAISVSWTSGWPEGTKSVATNRPTGSNNSTYVKEGMNLDHYWDSGDDDSDGHHKWVQMTQSGTSASPVVPTIATGLDAVSFCMAKEAADSLDNQDVQPFYVNNNTVDIAADPQVMQLLGIRAMAVFDSTGSPVTQYVHNIAPDTAVTPGIVKNNTGDFTATFTTELPSDNYLVIGGTTNGSVIVQAGTLANVKTSTFVKINTINRVGALQDQTQSWFIVFGG